MSKGKYLRKQKVSTGKKIGRAALIILLVLVLLIGAVLAFVWSKLSKITFDDGSVKYGYMERADEPTVEGTPLNKNTLFNSQNSERYGVETPSEAFGMISREWVVTVPAEGWSEEPTDGWYTNQVAVEDMLAVYNPIATLAITSAETVDNEQEAFGIVKEIETGNGYIICKASDSIGVDINVRLSGV